MRYLACALIFFLLGVAVENKAIGIDMTELLALQKSDLQKEAKIRALTGETYELAKQIKKLKGGECQTTLYGPQFRQ